MSKEENQPMYETAQGRQVCSTIGEITLSTIIVQALYENLY